MKRQQTILPWVLLVIPVLWLTALLASGYEEGMTLIDLMAVFPELMERPFTIRWTPHTLKFMLIGLTVSRRYLAGQWQVQPDMALRGYQLHPGVL